MEHEVHVKALSGVCLERRAPASHAPLADVALHEDNQAPPLSEVLEALVGEHCGLRLDAERFPCLLRVCNVQDRIRE